MIIDESCVGWGLMVVISDHDLVHVQEETAGDKDNLRGRILVVILHLC